MPDDFLDGLKLEESEARWAATLAEATSLILVAEDRDEVLGACTFGASRDADAPSLTGEIYSLNVHPSAWGRGLGRVLLAAATERLGSLGFVGVTLWVLQENGRARVLYERTGFVADGLERTKSDLIGVPLHEVRYRFVLNEKLAAG